MHIFEAFKNILNQKDPPPPQFLQYFLRDITIKKKKMFHVQIILDPSMYEIPLGV